MVLLLATAAAAAKYELRLPLQYDRYLPWSAASLGMGGTEVAAGGAMSIFGHPDRSCEFRRFEAGLSASALSAGRSHVAVESQASRTLPAAAAAAVRLGGHWLSAGYRRAMDDRLTFSDVLDPTLSDRAVLELDQAAIGWCYSTAGNASMGLSLSAWRAGFDWDGPAAVYAAGTATGFGFSGGLTIPVTQELKLSLAISPKSEIRGESDFLPDPDPSDLGLSGAIPSRTSAGVVYRPEAGFVFAAEAVLTGWNSVTQSYDGQIDLRLGSEIGLAGGLTLRLGAFTKSTPLDYFERRLDQTLQDMYFLTAGAGFSWRGLSLDLAGASSRPFSGGGQNQNVLAVSLEYGH